MRLYRLLLRLYPRSFREEYGAEMSRAFERERRDAGGFFSTAAVWIATIGDVTFNAARVHADVFRQDLRASTRTVWRTPGFAIAAIAVTALGVGAATAAFTLADHVLIRRLPFPDADQLVKIWEAAPNRPAGLRTFGGTNDVSPASYLDWKAASTSFSVMGAYAFVASNITGNGEPERIEGTGTSADTMVAIGVRPALGRALTASDDGHGAPCAVLISHGFWSRRFGADASIVSKTIRLDDETCNVAGVMPAGFDFPTRATAFWRPIRFSPEAAAARNNNYLRVIARLKPDVSIERAQAEMTAVSASIAAQHPKEEVASAAVLSLRDELSPQTRTMLLALVGAAGCLLLIACTNLASLVIARATARGRELAVRAAMGAGRARLVRQLLTESLMLALIGGGLGILLAIAAIPTAARLVPTALPIANVPPVDVRLLIVAALATLATGVGFGVLPALRASRAADSMGLREGARTGASRRTERVRATLVAAQVALSIVLVVCSGLLIRALMRVQSTPTGFDQEHVLTMRTALSTEKYGNTAPRADFYRRVIEDVKALPGVSSAAYTSFLPMTFRAGIWPVVIPGRVLPPGQSDAASSRYITPEYFHVMRIPLVAGREFNDADVPASQPVAIVSQGFVTRYLEGQPALGRTFEFGPGGARTIVGVVGEVRVRGLERVSEPQVYMPHQQQRDNQSLNYMPKDLVVRVDPTRLGAMSMDALVAPIRQIVAKVDPLQAIADVRPLEAIVEAETAPRTVQVRVLGTFAVLSCLLAGVGLHGLLAFVVSARTREFGVRLALGAEPSEILLLVARRGLMLGAIGIAAGTLVAWMVGRSLQALLAGLSPADPTTLAIATALALMLTLIGSVVPAIRASRTNPKDALSES